MNSEEVQNELNVKPEMRDSFFLFSVTLTISPHVIYQLTNLLPHAMQRICKLGYFYMSLLFFILKLGQTIFKHYCYNRVKPNNQTPSF